MIQIVITTFLCVFFIIIDLVPMYQKRQWTLFWTYSFLMASVYGLTLLISLGVKVPSPAIPLKKMVSVIWGL